MTFKLNRSHFIEEKEFIRKFPHPQLPHSPPCQQSPRTFSPLPSSFLWPRIGCMSRGSQTSVQTGSVSIGPNSNPFASLVSVLLLGKALLLPHTCPSQSCCLIPHSPPVTADCPLPSLSSLSSLAQSWLGFSQEPPLWSPNHQPQFLTAATRLPSPQPCTHEAALPSKASCWLPHRGLLLPRCAQNHTHM